MSMITGRNNPRGDQWSESHVPSTAAQATVTKAAPGVGKFFVCKGIIATIACGATPQTPIQVYLRDGASGAGAILYAFTVAAPANGQGGVAIHNIDIRGSENTAMTFEFSGAGVSASQQVVTLIGETVK